MNPDAEPLIVQRVKFKRAVSEPRRVDAAQSKDGARIEQLPLIVPRLRFSRTPDPIAAKNQAKEDERASFSSWVSSPGSDSVPRRKAPPSLTSTSTRSPPSSTTTHSDRVPRSTTPYKSSRGGEHDNSSRGYANPMTLTWSAKTPKPTKPSFTVKVELLKRGHQLIEVERFVGLVETVAKKRLAGDLTFRNQDRLQFEEACLEVANDNSMSLFSFDSYDNRWPIRYQMMEYLRKSAKKSRAAKRLKE